MLYCEKGIYMITYILIALLIASIIINIYFFSRKIKSSEKAKIEKDLGLLTDLMSQDRAIIEIKRIAPQSMFIRSPRDLK